MANEHFWDKGVGDISTEENCKVVFETLTGEKKTTPLMAIDKALKLLDVLKNGRQTVSGEVIKVEGEAEQTVQSFKLNVIEANGQKIVL